LLKEQKLCAATQGLIWKIRIFLFQSTSWKLGKSESGFLMFTKLDEDKVRAEDCLALKKIELREIQEGIIYVRTPRVI